MRLVRLAVAGLLSSAAMTGAAADDATLRLGHAIFTGALDLVPASARLNLPVRQVVRFPCANCHGRDGAGGTEGEAPPIHWPALATRSPLRGSYDGAAFHDAVTMGNDPEGRILTRLMPRYGFDPAATAALAAYLADLSVRDRRGVTPTTLDFCVVTGGHADGQSRAYATTLAEALTELAGETGLYGRQPKVITLDGSPEQVLAAAEEQCLSIIGLLVEEDLPLTTFTDRGVPVLFPFAQLSGREDRSIVRALRPTRRDVLAALVRDLGARKPSSIHVIGEDEKTDELLQMLRLDPVTADTEVTHGPDGPLPGEAALVALGPLPPDAVRNAGPAQRLWFLSSTLEMRTLPDGFDATVMIDAPGLVSFALGADLTAQEAHAMLAAEVLTAVIKVAGRDVGRAGLVRAFSIAALDHVGLDYETAPLSGTTDVLPLRLGSAE